MSKDILLLGEFSTGKSAFLNMLLGVQLLPEQLDSTNLPVVKIQAGDPGGIWLRETGQKNPRAIGSWSDIPQDWNEFAHAEVTVSGHPYLEKGLTFWDTPGINTTNSHHKQHLDDYLKSQDSGFLAVLFFVSGNLTSTSIEFLKQNRSLWDKMTIIVNIKEVLGERQSRQIETEVKKTVRTQIGNLPVELLYIGDACEEFNDLSEKNRIGLSDYELMRKWSELRIELSELLERHDDEVIGTDLFEIILTYADMPESDVEKVADEDETQKTASKANSVENASTGIPKNAPTKSTTTKAEEFDLLIKKARSLIKKKKPNEALALFQKAANKKQAEAFYALGQSYFDELGINENSKLSAKLYEKAADHGHAEAQFELGKHYYFGDGKKQDGKKAVKWLKKAANQGHIAAEYVIGLCLDNHVKGIERNRAEARKWFKKAAKKGHAAAKVRLM
jgi:hypothetical protein